MLDKFRLLAIFLVISFIINTVGNEVYATTITIPTIPTPTDTSFLEEQFPGVDDKLDSYTNKALNFLDNTIESAYNIYVMSKNATLNVAFSLVKSNKNVKAYVAQEVERTQLFKLANDIENYGDFGQWYKDNVQIANGKMFVKARVWSDFTSSYNYQMVECDTIPELLENAPSIFRPFLKTMLTEWFNALARASAFLVAFTDGINPTGSEFNIFDYLDTIPTTYEYGGVVYNLPYIFLFTGNGDYQVVVSEAIPYYSSSVGNLYLPSQDGSRWFRFKFNQYTQTWSFQQANMTGFGSYSGYSLSLFTGAWGEILYSNFSVDGYFNATDSVPVNSNAYNTSVYVPDVTGVGGQVVSEDDTPLTVDVGLETDEEGNIIVMPTPVDINLDGLSDSIDENTSVMREVASDVEAIKNNMDNNNNEKENLKQGYPSLKNLLLGKLGLFNQMREFLLAIWNATYSDDIPEFKINFNGLFGMQGSYSIVDFQFYSDYRNYIHMFMSAIAWAFFIKKMYRRIPNMITT